MFHNWQIYVQICVDSKIVKGLCLFMEPDGEQDRRALLAKCVGQWILSTLRCSGDDPREFHSSTFHSCRVSIIFTCFDIFQNCWGHYDIKNWQTCLSLAWWAAVWGGQVAWEGGGVLCYSEAMSTLKFSNAVVCVDSFLIIVTIYLNSSKFLKRSPYFFSVCQSRHGFASLRFSQLSFRHRPVPTL